jgi:hypothetical protein
MTAPNQWTELLTCSNCSMSGLARLSQPEKRAFDFSVEGIPTRFQVVRLEFERYLLLCSLRSAGAHQIAGAGPFN